VRGQVEDYDNVKGEEEGFPIGRRRQWTSAPANKTSYALCLVRNKEETTRREGYAIIPECPRKIGAYKLFKGVKM